LVLVNGELNWHLVILCVNIGPQGPRSAFSGCCARQSRAHGISSQWVDAPINLHHAIGLLGDWVNWRLRASELRSSLSNHTSDRLSRHLRRVLEESQKTFCKVVKTRSSSPTARPIHRLLICADATMASIEWNSSKMQPRGSYCAAMEARLIECARLPRPKRARLWVCRPLTRCPAGNTRVSGGPARPAPKRTQSSPLGPFLAARGPGGAAA
jgi:hypothetical protein